MSKSNELQRECQLLTQQEKEASTKLAEKSEQNEAMRELLLRGASEVQGLLPLAAACLACGDDDGHGYVCSSAAEPHWFHRACTDGLLRAATALTPDGRHIPCPVRGCSGGIVPTEHVLAAKTKHEDLKRVLGDTVDMSPLASAFRLVESRIATASAASAGPAGPAGGDSPATLGKRLYDSCVFGCPECGSEYTGHDGCMVVTCARDACTAQYCGACFLPLPRASSIAHQHSRIHNVTNLEVGYFVNKDLYRDLWHPQLRAERMSALLFSDGHRLRHPKGLTEAALAVMNDHLLESPFVQTRHVNWQHPHPALRDAGVVFKPLEVGEEPEMATVVGGGYHQAIDIAEDDEEATAGGEGAAGIDFDL